MDLHPDVIRAIRGVDPGVRSGFDRSLRRNRSSFRDRKALYAATLVESGGRNITGGDADSTGALQQRPSQGWGPVGESPEKDATQFLAAARRLCTPEMSSAQCAQAVQRSAFPDRYGRSNVQQAAQRLAGGGGGSPSLQTPSKTEVTLGTKTIPGQSFAEERQQARRDLLTGGPINMKRLLDYKSTVSGLQDVPDRQVAGDLKVKHAPAAPAAPADDRGVPTKRGPARVKIEGANPGRLKPNVVSFVRRLSQYSGEPLTVNSGAGHSRLTVDGNVSQHSTGDAGDIRASGARLTRLGQMALILAGMPPAKARKQKGGLYNVNGHQIIFNTNEGGNHWDHLHYGD